MESPAFMILLCAFLISFITTLVLSNKLRGQQIELFFSSVRIKSQREEILRLNKRLIIQKSRSE
jgi:hypothetical protein